MRAGVTTAEGANTAPARSLRALLYDKVVPVAVLVLSSPKFILFPIRIPFYLLGLLY